MVYQDGAFGKFYVKRFNITGVIRGKEYSLTKGSKGSRIVYLSVNPNGEAERIKVNLKPAPRMRLNYIEYDFAELAIKSKSAQGNILTPRVVTTISKKSEGISTLSARKIWFDQSIRRLNDDGRGLFLGEFSGDDRILTIYASGHYRLTNYDLSNHFDDDLIVIEKFNSEKPVSLFYLEAESKCVYFKRFLIEQSNKKINILEEQKDSKLICVSTDWRPVAEIDGKEAVIEDLSDIKKYRAKGKKISKDDKCDVKFTTPLPYEEKTEDNTVTDDDGNDELNDKDGIQASLF